MSKIDDHVIGGGGGSGSGDITSVGDGLTGATYDGSATGGSYVRLYDGATYTSLTAGTRALTIGSSATNAEDFILTLGSNDNTVTFSSSTGAAFYLGTSTLGQNLTIRATEGTELVITNPSFTSDLSGWTGGADWTWVAGSAVHAATAGNTLYPAVPLVISAGTNYKIVFTLSGWSAGSITMTLGGVLGTVRAADGTFTSYIIAATTGNLIFTPTSDFVGAIDVVSVKPITQGTFTSEGLNSFSGRILLESGSAYAPAIVWDDAYKLGIYRYAGAALGIATLGALVHYFGNGLQWINSNTGQLQFGTSQDVILGRDAANALALRRTTNQQILRIYNTADAFGTLTNYERLALTGVAGASVNITAETAGTGGDNLDVVLTPAGTGTVNVIGSLNTTGTRVTKGWFTDLEITNSPTVNGTAISAIYQPVDATLTALAGLTIVDASIIQGTGTDAFSVLASGGNNYILGSTSDNSALEFKTPAATLTAIGGAPLASPTFTGVVTSPTFAASGAVTVSPFSAAGAQFRVVASTISDASPPGTKAVGAASSFGIPTFASDGNSITVTDACTVYIAGVPLDAGANIALTRVWGLYQAAGNAYFAGNFSIGTTESQGKLNVLGMTAATPTMIGGSFIATLTGVSISNANPSVMTLDATIDDNVAVGDLVIVVSGTNATVGQYRVASIVANTSVTLDRQAATGACSDGVISYYKDVITISPTDGTNGQMITGYSHQNLPLQIGGSTLIAGDGGYTGSSTDVRITGTQLMVPSYMYFAGSGMYFGYASGWRIGGDTLSFYPYTDNQLDLGVGAYGFYTPGKRWKRIFGMSLNITGMTTITPSIFGGSIVGDGVYGTVTFPTADKTQIDKTGAFTNAVVGDLILIEGGTGATTGSYRLTTRTSADSIKVDRNIHASGTDITNGVIDIFKDVITISPTDGTNGQMITSWSHQNKPIQIGGTVLSATGHSLTSTDVLMGGKLEVDGDAYFDSSVILKQNIIDGATALSLSAVQVSATIISNTGQGVNDVNHTLPTAAAGYYFRVIIGETQGANYFRFTRSGSDTIIADGVTGKTYINEVSPTQGDQLDVYTLQCASTGIKTGAALAMGSTKDRVANGAFTFDAAGAGYAEAADAVGTELNAITTPQNKYGAQALDIGADGTIDPISCTNIATGFDTPGEAVTDLPAAAANHARMGYVTAMNSAAGGFIWGTTEFDVATVTEAFTSSTAYTKPYCWIAHTIRGTWATD